MSRYLKGRGFALQTVAAQLLATLAISALALAIDHQIAISLFAEQATVRTGNVRGVDCPGRVAAVP